MHTVPVAVNTPLRRHFDYRVPAPLVDRVQAGARLRVPFGSRQVIGVALDTPRPLETDDPRLRDVAACLDEVPTIGTELLATLRWAAAYYHHPIGEVIATALPALLRGGRSKPETPPEWLCATASGLEALPELARRAPKQAAVLTALRDGPLPRAGLDTGRVRVLLDKGYCELVPPPPPAIAEDPPPQQVRLSDIQQQALDALRRDGFGVDLLQGVTGSGKTELYLEQARALLSDGRQGLLLVPEIGLTPQLLDRARARLGSNVAAYHSGMSDRERLKLWQRVADGEALLVVGTRSAVWLPFSALGRVWVDEEHDASFKQQDGLRYSARDIAIVRARSFGAPVVLGSATPALESLANARAGRYGHVRLSARDAAAGAPIRLVDARHQTLRAGLTPVLHESIRRHLDAGGQVLIFINRRGYSPALICRECGWSAQCRACDAHMAWHKRRQRLLCHHCGAQQPVPPTCPACGAEELVPAGQGTERVEERLRSAFPDATLARVDSDAMQRSGSWERLRQEIHDGRVQLLVGTQMLAKGHDFPGITLVGVVSVDQALFSSDLRATERLGQLVMQVAGRAGRGPSAGEVLLQTHLPEHPLLVKLLRDGYDAFADSLLAERAQMGLPPARPLALLRAESAHPTAAMDFLGQAAGSLRDSGIEVLGPVPAPMVRRAGRNRAQLWLQAATRPALQQALAHHIEALERAPLARRVRWAVDVDPADTL